MKTEWSPSRTSTATWPGLCPGTGTSATSPSDVSGRLDGNGPTGSGRSSTGVGANHDGQRLLG